MCLTLPLSFDDNKVLKKLSIGYANICSSVQDQRQKCSVHFLSIGSERTNECNEIIKKKV